MPLMSALSAGDLSPEEGQALAAIIETQRKAIEDRGIAAAHRRAGVEGGKDGMSADTIRRRLARMERNAAEPERLNVLMPPSWLTICEHERWRTEQVAKAGPGAKCLTVRFVRRSGGGSYRPESRS